MTKSNSEEMFNSYIGKGYKLTSEFEKVEGLSTKEDVVSDGLTFPWVQGGCTDGTHYYCCMITNNTVHPTRAVILKYDLATQTLLKQSQAMDLGHANDAAYNPYNNTITVIGGGPVHYVLDADSLTVVRLVKAEFSSGVVSYDPDEHLYMIGNNFTFCLYDDDFNLLRTLPIEGLMTAFDAETGNMGSQGMTRDKDYMYYLEYWQSKTSVRDIRCNIAVYDVHSGEFIERVPLYMGREVENIFIWNDSFYIVCNNLSWNRAYCYKVKVIPEE